MPRWLLSPLKQQMLSRFLPNGTSCAGTVSNRNAHSFSNSPAGFFGQNVISIVPSFGLRVPAAGKERNFPL